MIKIIEKSVFNSGCDLLVNTINCHGIMAAGIALEFSLRYPLMFEKYKEECSLGKIKVGKTYLYEENGQKILNFPTKGDNPRDPSLLEYVIEGLDYFVNHYQEYDVKSVAFPPLGCLNGKLDFETMVKPIMLEKLKDLDLDIYICLNVAPLEGLEKEMTETLQKVDVNLLHGCFEKEEDYLSFISKYKEVDRFSALASKKYLPNERTYRNLWETIYKITKEKVE